MFADSSLELDDMAAQLRLKPHWKQAPLEPGEHYDLVPGLRQQAIGLGAIPVNGRQFTVIIERKRAEGRV
jgi:hypothetical protein